MGSPYYIIRAFLFKGGINLAGGKKRGPKTDNPKEHRITVKLDNEAKEILDAYCEQESVSIMEGARRGIKRLKPDLKK